MHYEVCLPLFTNEKYFNLYELDCLDIGGKELETLKENCLVEDTLDYLTQTISFFRLEFLRSKKPIPFIDRILEVEDDWKLAYEHFAGNF